MPNTTLFDSAQLASLYDNVGIYARQVVKQSNTLYAYLSNSELLYLENNSSEPKVYCLLPEIPPATSLTYNELDSFTKQQWDKMVSIISVGDDTLWGINIYNGRIGKISPDGIEWNTIALSLDLLWPQNIRWPLRVVNSFVEDNKLFAFVAYDDVALPFNNYTMLVFDLTTGHCSEIVLDNAQAVGMYEKGKVFILHESESELWTIEILDLLSNIIYPSAFLPIENEDTAPLGGITYDLNTKRLMFTKNGQVWAGVEGAPYYRVATIPIANETIDSTAFILEDGRYALFAKALYLREVASIITQAASLYVQGAMDPGIYASFLQENPEVDVTFTGGMLSADSIVQALVTGDETADIYAVFADNTFKAAVEKGYVAPLTSSSDITLDVQEMYPNIQAVITDTSGAPVAYPYTIILTNWQMNDQMWAQVFGDTPPPRTFAEFLDAMLLCKSCTFPQLAFNRFLPLAV